MAMKKKMLYLMMLVLVLAFAAVGCNSTEKADNKKDDKTSVQEKDKEKDKEKEKTVEAKAIDAKVDKCENCKMAVADNEDATEIVLKDGKTLVFDDIGCMVNKWVRANGTDDIDVAFVRDHDSKKWLDWEKAYYVFDAKITTAMGYGVIAFEDKDAAQKYIDEKKMGKLMTKAELDKHTWPQDRNNMTMKMHKDSSDGMKM